MAKEAGAYAPATAPEMSAADRVFPSGLRESSYLAIRETDSLAPEPVARLVLISTAKTEVLTDPISPYPLVRHDNLQVIGPPKGKHGTRVNTSRLTEYIPKGQRFPLRCRCHREVLVR